MLSKEFLADLLGEGILDYLTAREAGVSNLYEQVVDTAHAFGVNFKYEDQSSLLDFDSANTLNRSWELGIDNQAISKVVDKFEPLTYRKSPEAVSALISAYKKEVSTPIATILRPNFPDCTEENNLISKVNALKNLGVSEIDFYLLDTFRPRDLKWISKAIS